MQGHPKPPSRPAQIPVVVVHVQGKSVQARGKKRYVSSPFNIIEQMKKTIVNISMWESVSIPGQRDLLQSAMNNWSTSNQQGHMQEKVLTNVTQPEGNIGGQQ
ncbi:hypothetical protein KI387_036463, partial [Taxus chinensis]